MKPYIVFLIAATFAGVAEKVSSIPVRQVIDSELLITPFTKLPNDIAVEIEQSFEKLENTFNEYPVLASLFHDLNIILNNREQIEDRINGDLKFHFKENLNFLQEILKKINAMAVVLGEENIESIKEILYGFGFIEKDDDSKLVGEEEYNKVNENIKDVDQNHADRNIEEDNDKSGYDWSDADLDVNGEFDFDTNAEENANMNAEGDSDEGAEGDADEDAERDSDEDAEEDVDENITANADSEIEEDFNKTDENNVVDYYDEDYSFDPETGDWNF
ncbi:hypothetical protein PGB90_000662 [Kerria lacca]